MLHAHTCQAVFIDSVRRTVRPLDVRLQEPSRPRAIERLCAHLFPGGSECIDIDSRHVAVIGTPAREVLWDSGVRYFKVDAPLYAAALPGPAAIVRVGSRGEVRGATRQPASWERLITWDQAPHVTPAFGSARPKDPLRYAGTSRVTADAPSLTNE